MTEVEFDACEDPENLLAFVLPALSERKLRLLSCALVRRVWDHLHDPRSRRAVEVAEQFADGGAGRAELKAARQDAQAAYDEVLTAIIKRTIPEGSDTPRLPASFAAYRVALVNAAPGARDAIQRGGWVALRCDRFRQEREAQAALVCDICGPLPFRPIAIAPSLPTWRDGCVAKLARAAYEARILPSGLLHPDSLGVLADAVEESGFDDGSLSQHLRSPGPHVRGFAWLDALLPKR